REFTAGRPHARHVRGPTLGSLRTYIGQQQVLVREQAVVALVVQHFAVHGDDRVVRADAARTDDGGFHRRAHAEFTHAGVGGAHTCAVRALGDARRETQLGNRRRVVLQADLDHGFAQLAIGAFELETRALD